MRCRGTCRLFLALSDGWGKMGGLGRRGVLAESDWGELFCGVVCLEYFLFLMNGNFWCH